MYCKYCIQKFGLMRKKCNCGTCKSSTCHERLISVDKQAFFAAMVNLVCHDT